MLEELKKLISTLSKNFFELRFLIQQKTNENSNKLIDIEKRIDNNIKNIFSSLEAIDEIGNDLKWDQRTNRKFEKLNALLLIVPTVIGIIILCVGLPQILDSKKVSSDLQDQLSKRDSTIKALSSQLNANNSISLNAYEKNHLLDSIKSLNKKIDISKNKNGISGPIYFEKTISDNYDNINLQKRNFRLLILRNTKYPTLKLSIIKPNLTLDDILVRDLSMTSWPGTFSEVTILNKNRSLILDLDKLPSVTKTIVIRVENVENSKISLLQVNL